MTSTAVASHQPYSPEAGPGPAPGATADALPVFASDRTVGDALDRHDAVALLAEVVLHRGSETPLTLGIFGPAGSGKSRFLGAVVDAATDLAAKAGSRATSGPFISRVVVARVDAAPGREPSALLAGAVIAALAGDHAAFVEDAIHAGGDPGEAARRAGERVNTLRGTLDAERQTLDTLGARRARLTETVLFDATGSRVDAFARANRGRIEARLRAFGLPAADPIRTFKDLVRDHSEPSGGASRLGLTLRALWGFKGQRQLILTAVLLAIVGWAAGLGADNPDAVANWLAGFGDRFTALTDWGRAHLDLLQPLSRIAFAFAVLALLADIVRATRFLGPVFKGIALLKGELDGRRRDLDGLLAHQTRRVDALSADAEAAGRGAEAARRRAEGLRGGRRGLSDGGAALARERFGLSRTPDAAAEPLFADLSDGIATGLEGAPERIIVAIDGLDNLSPVETAAFLGTLHRLLNRHGFVAITAMERDAVAAALGEVDPALAAARLDRSVQLSYDLGAVPLDTGALVGRLLDPRALEDKPRVPADASRSSLDGAFQPFETELVTKLASFAGGTPRAIKRFVNSYRVARADPRLTPAAPAALGALALALALDGTGGGSELTAFDGELAQGKMTVEQSSDLGRAFVTIQSVIGQEVDVQEVVAQDLRRGLAVARSYSRRG